MSWYKVKGKYTSGSISTSKYDDWRHRYPALDTSGKYKRVQSKEFSDAITKALNKKSKNK